MEIDLAVLADAANVTAEGKINVIGVFRNINTMQLPAILPNFHLVISLTPLEEELGSNHKFEFYFRRPGNETSVKIAEGGFNFPRQNEYNYPMLNIMAGFTNLQVIEIGLHGFEIVVDGNLAKTIPLFVSKPSNLQIQPNLLIQPKPLQ